MIHKQDLVGLADLVKGLPPNLSKRRLAEALADFLRGNNPNFDRQRWLDYVAGKSGPNGGKK